MIHPLTIKSIYNQRAGLKRRTDDEMNLSVAPLTGGLKFLLYTLESIPNVIAVKVNLVSLRVTDIEHDIVSNLDRWRLKYTLI